MKYDLFGYCIKVIVILIGVYLIIVNISSLALYYDTVGNVVGGETLHNATEFNFVGWHDYQPIQYKGFTWFFGKLETFPGFTNLRGFIAQMQKSSLDFAFDVQDGNIFAAIKYIANLFSAPFRVIWSVLVDIIQSLIWFFKFLI